MCWLADKHYYWSKSLSARKSDLQNRVREILSYKRQLNHLFPFTITSEACYINRLIAMNKVFFQPFFVSHFFLLFLFLFTGRFPVQQIFFEWWCPKLNSLFLLRSQQCWLEWNSPILYKMLRLMHPITTFPFFARALGGCGFCLFVKIMLTLLRSTNPLPHFFFFYIAFCTCKFFSVLSTWLWIFCCSFWI